MSASGTIRVRAIGPGGVQAISTCASYSEVTRAPLAGIDSPTFRVNFTAAGPKVTAAVGKPVVAIGTATRATPTGEPAVVAAVCPARNTPSAALVPAVHSGSVGAHREGRTHG